ncbi:cytochrome P450 [Actinomadura sp. B10D3]|uniref:cytochrome P450 n=1 Tax=Actinomadura sp. B10D3 TaxID=3153557 RepID=UPI00325C99A9
MLIPLPASEIARRDEAREEFAAYFRDLAARRRAEPRDDLLSALVSVSDGGDALSEEELLATCVLLLVAGHETTANLIGNGALALLRDPAQLELFRARPGNVQAAVEELLRYDPPVQLTRYTGGRDTPRHLSLGHGIHFCLGAPLARLEGQVALAKLFERDVALASGDLAHRDDLVLRGLRDLPVTIRA